MRYLRQFFTNYKILEFPLKFLLVMLTVFFHCDLFINIIEKHALTDKKSPSRPLGQNPEARQSTDIVLPPVLCPAFSVIIPSYNRAKIISRALDSVLAQTFFDYEIIVIDDGSNDDLKSVCYSYNNDNIYYYYQENSGACAARNLGIEKSRGYYISFLDSDDSWEPQYLNEVAKKFSEDEDFGLVWVKSIRKNLDNGHISFKKSKVFEGNIYAKILQQGYLTSTSFITVKSSLLKSIGGFDIELPGSHCDDDDLCFRIAKTAKIGYVNKILGTLYIDSSIERISTSKSHSTYGWFFLWCKFSDDVICHCGMKTLEEKLLNIYSMFYAINDTNGLNGVEIFFSEKLHLTKRQIKYKLFFYIIKNKKLSVLRKIKSKLFLILRYNYKKIGL